MSPGMLGGPAGQARPLQSSSKYRRHVHCSNSDMSLDKMPYKKRIHASYWARKGDT